MKNILRVAAIGLIAAGAFFVISFLLHVIISVLAVGLVARLIFVMGKYGKFRHHEGGRFQGRGRGNYGMQDASDAVAIDGDWYRSSMKQSVREQKITVF